MFRKSANTFLILLFGMAVLMPADADQTSQTMSDNPAGIVSEIPTASRSEASLDVGEIPIPCPESFMERATEGPYYKTGSPERRDLLEEGIPGVPIILTGYVYDKKCRPIPEAWIDFWQTDGNGSYDNRGYKLRGHQYTDKNGKYLLRTVLPGEYPGRTNHIHVKVRGHKGGAVTTSQLYFPGSRLNESDRIFSSTMLVTVTTGKNGEKVAFFNFRLNQ